MADSASSMQVSVNSSTSDNMFDEMSLRIFALMIVTFIDLPLRGMRLLLGHGMPKMKLVEFVGWLLMVVALIVNSLGMIAL
ncbi:hypothetical protein RD792_002067 [Penstemon davidsonii]|uniref:Uncharacterized protein n=1 Tax=Penstemon davidsonii TaxID=160366 RepID=A0ABR0DQQ6_9LAMI|nr:hypothetical protein RD792_002067 [Penstemon davidsonii]